MHQILFKLTCFIYSTNTYLKINLSFLGWICILVFNRHSSRSPLRTALKMNDPSQGFACRCPGVFKHTAKACGAALMFRIKHVEISNTNEYQTIYFYHCADPECDFRELLPDLKELPCLSCEAIDSKNFRVFFDSLQFHFVWQTTI